MTEQMNVKPKVVVTLSAVQHEWEKTFELVEQNLPFIDMIEYRADLCGEMSVDDYLNDVKQLKAQYADKPLIFTYRTQGQGGQGELLPHDYFELSKAVIEAEMIDIIDIELLLYEDLMEELLQAARHHHIQVLISHHDFEHTPSSKDLKAIYQRMKDLGADYCKVAVMPADGKDVLKLMMIVYETKRDCDKKVVGIAMGEQGKLSRLAAGTFGSDLTYGHIGKEAAPGQLHVQQLKTLMDIYQ